MLISFKISFVDASSSNEAVHLQQRLKSLSTELVTLRNRLHVGQTATAGSGGGAAGNLVNSNNNNNISNSTSVNQILPIGSSKVSC